MRIKENIKALFSDFIKSGIKTSSINSKKLLQVRLINLITVWLSLTVLILLLTCYYFAIEKLAPALIGSLLFACFILYWLRKSHNISLCSHLTLLNICILVTISNILYGGPQSPTFLWLLIIPVTAAAITNTQTLIGYLLASIFILVSSYSLYYLGITPLFNLSNLNLIPL